MTNFTKQRIQSYISTKLWSPTMTKIKFESKLIDLTFTLYHETEAKKIYD